MDNTAADLSRGLPAISRNLHLRSTLGKERASCRWHISSPGSRAQDAALWSGLGQDRQVRLPQICNPSGINWSQGEGEHLEPLIFWPAASNPATLYQPVDRTTFSAGYNFFNGWSSTLIAASGCARTFLPTSRQRFRDLWHFLHRPLFSWHFLGRFLQPVFHNAPFTDKMWVGRSNPKIWALSSSTNVQSRAGAERSSLAKPWSGWQAFSGGDE